MQIIDFEKKGNVVRFYLGDASTDYHGDDWDDRPYDCNAGEVYEEYVKGYRDMVFPFDDLVLEPCDGAYDCDVSKNDMKNQCVPCIVVVPKKIRNDYYETDFAYWVGAKESKRYYFGDEMEPGSASRDE
jgi:hypothetical protein